MASVTATLATSGLHCSSCSMLVDMTVAELQGVESVQTDHGTGKTVVVFDDSITSLDAVIGAIQSVGYEAETA